MMPRLRLEQRLPFLVSVVLTALLGVGTWLSYREVRAASIAAAFDRMESVAAQLAPLVTSGLQQRTRALSQLSAQPAVQDVLHGLRDATDPALLEAIEGVRAAPDTSVVVALVGRDRTVVVGVGDALAPIDPPSFALLAGLPDTATRISEFTVVDSVTYYWMAVPVAAEPGGGYLAQLRRLARGAATYQDLLGDGGTLYLANSAVDSWAEIGGTAGPAPVPLTHGVTEQVRFKRAGAWRLGAARPLPGTTLHLVVDRPVSAIMAPARGFAWRFGLVSALLVLTGLLVTAALSRWLVRPLSELSAAARDIAMGAHDRRVGIVRKDEIGQLADAFNSMAGEVERTIADARHSQRSAIQANAAKSAFLATMSHEIRTPINAIIGYIELLDMGVAGKLNAAQRQHIGRVREASRHLTGLVEDVLDLSKVEAGELRVDAVTCNSDTLCRDAASVVAPQARLCGVELSVECATVAFRGDPQRVRQILVNLLSNAVKFTDPGGSVALSCRYEESGDGVGGVCVFEVADTGCGIPPDQQHVIFDPFVQLDSGYTRTRGGAGLGLAISTQLARLMHGSITVSSAPGVGSTFLFRMPASAPVAVPAGA